MSEVVDEYDENRICFRKNKPDCKTFEDLQFDGLDYAGETQEASAENCARRCERTQDCIGASYFSPFCNLAFPDELPNAGLIETDNVISFSCKDVCDPDTFENEFPDIMMNDCTDIEKSSRDIACRHFLDRVLKLKQEGSNVFLEKDTT
eukprot:UN01780